MTGQHRFADRKYRVSNDEYAAARETADETDGLSVNLLVRAFFLGLRRRRAAVLRFFRYEIAAVKADTPRGRPRPKKTQ